MHDNPVLTAASQCAAPFKVLSRLTTAYIFLVAARAKERLLVVGILQRRHNNKNQRHNDSSVNIRTVYVFVIIFKRLLQLRTYWYMRRNSYWCCTRQQTISSRQVSHLLSGTAVVLRLLYYCTDCANKTSANCYCLQCLLECSLFYKPFKLQVAVDTFIRGHTLGKKSSPVQQTVVSTVVCLARAGVLLPSVRPQSIQSIAGYDER